VVFFLSLLIDGALAGSIYALIALAFVLVYKASRMVNFAIGEWVMWGALLVAVGTHAIGLGLGAAIVFACAGMIALAFVFSRLVLRRMTVSPVIASIMITLGLGAVMRGVGAVIFAGVPSAISLPVPTDPIILDGVPIATDKLVSAIVAIICITLVGGFYRFSRTGLALQALADDRQTAMSVGVDIDHHLLIVWVIVGVISVAAGALWTFVSGGGFGVALVGLKVFPIVIIGGLDSIAGAIVGAMIVGMLESLGAGYLDPTLGGGFGNIASYLLLIGMLVVRPSGLFGRRGSSGCKCRSAGADVISFCGIWRGAEHERRSVALAGHGCRGSDGFGR
jgi:branched-chain amino acid transport system permease protein